MRNILTLFILFFASLGLFGQDLTLEELKKQKADLAAKSAPVIAEADALKAQMDDINAKIATFPGWYKGAFGTLGANFTGRNNWFAAGELKNSTATTILGSFNAFANKIDTKYFWRNAASLNLGWQKLKTGKEGEGDPKFEPVADVLNVTSLFGYNLSSKLAVSTLAEYRTSIIQNFNNPGYLDIGAGITYTPIKNMVLVFHPLNYNFVFSDLDDKFTPSLGCKVLGDYNTTLYRGIKWRSNLSAFISYKNNDPSLHNGTWTNWFGFNLWKGIGVGIEHGLRFSAQERRELGITDTFQSYYVIGLSYSL